MVQTIYANYRHLHTIYANTSELEKIAFDLTTLWILPRHFPIFKAALEALLEEDPDAVFGRILSCKLF